MSQEPRASFRFCPQCASPLIAGANACPQCGFWVRDLANTQSQTIVPAPSGGSSSDASGWLQTRLSGVFPPPPLPPTIPQAPGGPTLWAPPPDMPSFPTYLPAGGSGPLVGGAPTMPG